MAFQFTLLNLTLDDFGWLFFINEACLLETNMGSHILFVSLPQNLWNCPIALRFCIEVQFQWKNTYVGVNMAQIGAIQDKYDQIRVNKAT